MAKRNNGITNRPEYPKIRDKRMFERSLKSDGGHFKDMKSEPHVHAQNPLC